MSKLIVKELDAPSGSNITAPDIERVYQAGEIVQVVTVKPTLTSTFNSSSYVDGAGFSVDITPKYSNSKLVVSIWAKTVHINGSSNSAQDYRLLRDGSSIFESKWQNYFNKAWATSDFYPPFDVSFEDSPNTTSQVTYKLQGRLYAGDQAQWKINEANGGTAQAYMSVTEIKQ